jgi:hypothetical protein
MKRAIKNERRRREVEKGISTRAWASSALKINKTTRKNKNHLQLGAQGGENDEKEAQKEKMFT